MTTPGRQLQTILQHVQPANEETMNPYTHTWDTKNIEEPLHHRKPRVIRVTQDLFAPGVAFEYVDQRMAVMALTPQHQYQIVTEHTERMAEYTSTMHTRLSIGGGVTVAAARLKNSPCPPRTEMYFPRVLPNVHLGVPIHDQPTAKSRIPHLLRCPSAVRFLNAEPLLGPVDLRGRLLNREWNVGLPGIDWVIVGGESGPGARPLHPQWVRSIRDHCQAARVPFFFKQWGEWYPNSQHKLVPCGKFPSINSATEWLRDAQGSPEYYRVGKKAAGRLLDGREWNEMPARQEPRT